MPLRILLAVLVALACPTSQAWATGPQFGPMSGGGSGVVANTCTAGDFFSAVDGSGNFTCSTPSGSGDVTAVGDCASGACFTGSSGTTLTGLADTTFLLESQRSVYVNVDTDNNSTSHGFFVGLNGTGTATTRLFIVQEAGQVELRNGTDLRLYETDDSNYVQVATPSLSANWTLTLPADDGNSGQFLQTDGSGTTTWATPSGSGNVSNTGTPADNQVAVWTDATTIEGTSGLTFSAGTLTATTFSGALSGNATTATTAGAGDSATAFFSSGTIEAARLPDADDDATTKGVITLPNAQFDCTSGSCSIASGGVGSTELGDGSIVNADVNASAAIALSKLANMSTDRLLGRDTASTGAIEEIAVGGGVEFSGSTGIQRSALTGDVTASAGSNTTAIASGVIVDGDVNASAGILFSKLATTNTDRLLGRDTAGGGAVEELTVGGGVEFTGTGIQRSALTGDVTASAGSGTTAIGAGVIIDADVNASAAIASSKLAAAATDRILGRDTAGAGAVEELTVGGGLEFTGSGGLQRSALTGDVTASAGSGTTTIGANAVDLGADTTGNYVATVAGTSNEVSVSGSGSETAAVTVSLPSTIDLGGKTSFEVPNGAAPTTDAFGELAGDSDAWAASRGAPQWFDGTANTYLVGALASDTPADGQVPKWNTGGTITWENDSTGVIADLPAAGCNASTAASFWDLPSSNAPAAACYGSNYPRGVLDFDASTDETAYNSVMLPTPWTGSLYADIYWFATATTNETQWGVQVVCAGSSEPSDPSFNTVSTVSTTVDGTTTDVTKSTVTVATTTGCSAGEIMHVKLYRDADAGGGVDDMTGDARLLRVVLRQ